MTEATSTSRRARVFAVALLASTLVVAGGCSSPDDVTSDASIDVQRADDALDVTSNDTATSDAPSTDRATVDASMSDAASDAATADVVAPDVAAPDVVAPTDAGADAPAVDVVAPMDVIAADVPRVDVITPADAGVDVPRTDVVTPVDTGVDAPRTDVVTPVDTGVDVPRTDTGVVDVPAVDTGCTGAFTVRVTAPTANQEIETCTVSGAPVYFNFTAEPSSPATSVEFAWRTPDGALAPPPWPAITAAPYVARRQVGGMMIDVPPLAVLSRRGTWQLEVVARDRCGRTAMTSQPFTLIYTNRDCPNP